MIPEDNNIVVLAGSEQKDIIDCFTNQFVKKKRNYCKVLDSGNQPIKPTELNFIYYPYGNDINSNFEFGIKSIFNIETTNLMQENENDFKSFELIREGFRNLTTDHGMYKLREILTRNIQCNINFEISDFDISKFLSMLDINADGISVDKQYIMVYNLLLFVSRNQFNNISYIQNPYTMLHKQQQTEKNIRLMEQFEDKNTTFYLTFNDTYTQDIL